MLKNLMLNLMLKNLSSLAYLYSVHHRNNKLAGRLTDKAMTDKAIRSKAIRSKAIRSKAIRSKAIRSKAYSQGAY